MLSNALRKLARLVGRPIKETRMSSSSSLAKFSNILGSVQTGGSQNVVQPIDPGTTILRLCLDNRMVPVSDLPELSRLSNDEILATVEKLRSRQQVEIVELPDQPGRKFIRLTKAGYDFFAA